MATIKLCTFTTVSMRAMRVSNPQPDGFRVSLSLRAKPTDLMQRMTSSHWFATEAEADAAIAAIVRCGEVDTQAFGC